MFQSAKISYEGYGEYVQDLMQNIQKSAYYCTQYVNNSSRRMQRNYDLNILLRPYTVTEGDVVYLLDTAVTKGKTRKLCSPWKGSTLIINSRAVMALDRSPDFICF